MLTEHIVDTYLMKGEDQVERSNAQFSWVSYCSNIRSIVEFESECLFQREETYVRIGYCSIEDDKFCAVKIYSDTMSLRKISVKIVYCVCYLKINFVLTFAVFKHSR